MTVAVSSLVINRDERLLTAKKHCGAGHLACPLKTHFHSSGKGSPRGTSLPTTTGMPVAVTNQQQRRAK